MKSPMRLIAKLLFLAVVLMLLGVGIVLAWFTSWRSDKIAELSSGSEIARTSLGEVEFTVRGDGPPVLVFHGAPGGYDQAMLLGSSLSDEGFQIIAPSRPGYLRTPLADRLTPSRQADAMEALLDTLGAPGVAVIGYSSGAPAALEFARKFPGRTWAVILISPVTTRFDHYDKLGGKEPGVLVLTGLKGDIGSWVAVEAVAKDPSRLLNDMLLSEGDTNASLRKTTVDYVIGHERQLDWFKSLIGTFAPLGPRDAGTRNDMVQIRGMAPFPFEEISAPVLLIHGDQDKIIPIEQARAAAARFPSGTFFEVAGAGHIPQLGPLGDEVQKRVAEFLRRYSGGQTQP